MNRAHADWIPFARQLSPTGKPELVQLMWQLRRAARLAYQQGEKSLEEAGLSFAQFRVLMHLLYGEEVERRAGLFPSDISRLHGTNRNTISALLRSLEQSKLITRVRDDADRRRFIIALTEAGRRIVRRHAQSYVESVTEIFDGLQPDEVETLARLLKRIDQRADQLQE